MSVPLSTVLGMDRMRHLRSVNPSTPAGSTPSPTPSAASEEADLVDGTVPGAPDAREDYWARVQRLRAELDRLRPAN